MKSKFELAHIGINHNDDKKAKESAKLLCTLFNLEEKEGETNVYAGKIFECMKFNSHGENGHIGLLTNNLQEAVLELENKGFKFKEGTAVYKENDKLHNIYLDLEISGFAIHILQKY